MGKKGDIAGAGSQRGHQSIGAPADLLEGFAAGAPLLEEIPIGIPLPNFFGSKAFKIAIVPFSEIGIYDQGRRKTGEHAGALSALAGTGPHEGERE